MISTTPVSRQPQLVGNRYLLTQEPVREGGMSTVQQAFDSVTSRLCAIKRMKIAHQDDLRWKESFHREYMALSDLSPHPNIVALYDIGLDEEGAYLVLEWVPYNLNNWISKHGPLHWQEFYTSLGRPILDALVFVQSRGWNHRDIKPQNILIEESGAPKISDYGIAKQFEKPALGLTFNQFRSAPFTPPEDDSGNWSRSRDCFSWAALAIYCITGEIPNDYGELSNLADDLDPEKVPATILQQALSHTPAERPPLASSLLEELDEHKSKKIAQGRLPRKCYLELEENCLQRLLRELAVSDRQAVEAHLLEELNEIQVGFRRRNGTGIGQGDLRLSAVTWVFDVYLLSGKCDRLVISKAWRARAGEVERHRENGYRTQMEFTFKTPINSALSASALQELVFDVESFEADHRDALVQAQRERVFRIWYAFLRAKADYEARRENAITYVNFRVNESTITLTTELPPAIDTIGQSRVIRGVSGGHLFCDIVDVNLDEVTVIPTYGDVSRIPRQGKLEVNTIAAEKAIERQRRALDAVNYNRAASPRLKGIIVDPSTARSALGVPKPKVGGGPFDPEKIEILQRALGVQDVLAIQGPPGTGKTRLIEEILVQYLDRNPTHRVLLSSQTHVALDNVIERVLIRQPALNIVRIGRLDDPKINASVRDLVLDRKAQAWSDQVRDRAHHFMEQWARDRGIDRSGIVVGMLAERLIQFLQQERQLKASLAEAQQRVNSVQDRAETKLSETGSADSSDIAVASLEAEQSAGVFRSALTKMQRAIGDARDKLREAGGYGLELAEQGEPNDLGEWSTMLLGSGGDRRRCRALLELQEEWILRVGKSSDFHAAMLTSAQVVAGTCIGMAGVRGMGEVIYDLCIVDEASKATATEILVPMSRSRKWILVGDPAQLPPFFEDESINRIEGFDEIEVRETLLDILLKRLPDESLALLTNQHRMVKPIGDLISEAFYEGKLNSLRSKPSVTLPGAFPKPVTWLSTSDAPDVREIRRGQSFCNDAECRIIRDALGQINFVARKRKAVYEVALIAGYIAQVKSLQDIIRDRLHEWVGLKITCSTVDAFQGSEAEICIYSVTRSNMEGKLGFLREKPRLNVALSRGRSALIMVGDDDFCRSIEGENPFRRVLDFFEAHPESCERRCVQ